MTVYVVNEPIRANGSSYFNLTSALDFGELAYVLPAGTPTLDARSMMVRIEEAMAGFTQADYLLPVGNMAACCLAAAVAARKGPVRVLRWHTGVQRYEALPGL